MNIRPATESDAEQMWNIFRSVSERGDTVPVCTSASKEAMAVEWFDDSVLSFVAIDAGTVVGMYTVGANQPDRGAHVATATFMVHPSHRRKGIGGALVAHCLATAEASGFCSIQFNFVVSTNVAALSLYGKLGFSIVGTLPAAFLHSEFGPVDAHVMFKALCADGSRPDPRQHVPEGQDAGQTSRRDRIPAP